MLKVNGKKLISKVKFANNTLERMKGLMFENEKKFDYALVFSFPKKGRVETSLHMMFVFFPITAVFLDENKIVTDVALLTPFTPNYTPKSPSKFVIELPAIYSKNIKIKDKVEWDEPKGIITKAVKVPLNKIKNTTLLLKRRKESL